MKQSHAGCKFLTVAEIYNEFPSTQYHSSLRSITKHGLIVLIKTQPGANS